MQDYLPPTVQPQTHPPMQLKLVIPKDPVDPETLVNYKGEVLITKLFLGNYIDEAYIKLLHKNSTQGIIHNSGMIELITFN